MKISIYSSLLSVILLFAGGSMALGQETIGQMFEEMMEQSEGFEEAEEFEEPEEIETDRDSFTPTTSIAPLGGWVIESAYTFIDNRDVAETHSFPEFLLRYGWTDRTELRLGWNYEVGGAGSPVSGNVGGHRGAGADTEEESRMYYGIKHRLVEQCGYRPHTAFILQGYTPTAGESTATTVSTSLITGWNLSNGWTWDSALRYNTSSFEDDRFNVWEPSTVIKVPFGHRWKGHLEYFAIATDGRADETVQHYASPGIHYLISPNFEVGIRTGWGLNNEAANFFTNIGFGVQF